jgi:NADH:ubiquinone oxidoreductase subunit D
MAQDAPEGWFDDVLGFCKEMRDGVDEIQRLFIDNKIFVKRTQGVCPVKAADAIQWGYTGPLLRASGVGLDLRKIKPYYGYDALDFDIPVILGVLMTENEAQAWDRLGGAHGHKGRDAVDTALAMHDILQKIAVRHR